MSLPTSSRAISTAFSARQPKTWLRDAALPKSSRKNGSMASSTRGSTGVVEWLSMKIGTFTAILISASMNSGNEDRLRAFLVAIVVARRALLELMRLGLARAAALEVRQAGVEIALELREPRNLIAGFAQAVGEHLAHALHGERGDARLLAHAVQKILEVV